MNNPSNNDEHLWDYVIEEALSDTPPPDLTEKAVERMQTRKGELVITPRGRVKYERPHQGGGQRFKLVAAAAAVVIGIGLLTWAGLREGGVFVGPPNGGVQHNAHLGGGNEETSDKEDIEDGGLRSPSKEQERKEVHAFFKRLNEAKDGHAEKKVIEEMVEWLQLPRARAVEGYRLELSKPRDPNLYLYAGDLPDLARSSGLVSLKLACPYFPPVTPWTTHTFKDKNNIRLLKVVLPKEKARKVDWDNLDGKGLRKLLSNATRADVIDRAARWRTHITSQDLRSLSEAVPDEIERTPVVGGRWPPSYEVRFVEARGEILTLLIDPTIDVMALRSPEDGQIVTLRKSVALTKALAPWLSQGVRSDADIEALPANSEWITTIVTVSRGGTGASSATLQGVRSLTRFKKLKRLELYGFAQNDVMVQDYLPTISSINTLEQLVIGERTYSPQRQNWSSIAQFRNLRYLEVHESYATDSAFANIAKIKKLQVLRIDDLDAENAKWLEHLSLSRHLEELVLENSTLGDDDLANIAKVSTLKILNLSECLNITDKGIKHISKLVRLEKLDLSSAPIYGRNGKAMNADEYIKLTNASLAHISKLANLRDLNLYRCEDMDGEGLVHLKDVGSLERLNIGAWVLTAKNLEHLYPLNNLRWLSIVCSETPDGGGDVPVDAFRKALPDCAVVTSGNHRLPPLKE